MNCLVAKIIVWYFMRAWRKIAHAYYYDDDDGGGGREDVDREAKNAFHWGYFEKRERDSISMIITN